MKHSFLFAVMIFSALVLGAQPGFRPNPHAHLVPITVQAADNEAFAVYVDGTPVPSRSEQIVDVNVDDRDQTLYIRLKRPEDRIVPITLQRGRIHALYEVRYDPMRREVNILAKDPPRQVAPPPAPGHGPAGPAAHAPASRSDIRQLLRDLDKTPMSEDKLTLAKTFIRKVSLTTNQALDIAGAFTFDDDKTDILIFAYDHVTDKQNYRHAVEAVTFSANKEKLFKLVTR